MDWVKIILTVLLVIAGYFVSYFRKKTELVEKAKYAINGAEQIYEDVAKAGGKKMEYAITYLYEFVPPLLKPFITKEMLREIIQTAFNSMAAFADKQLDKVVDKYVKATD